MIPTYYTRSPSVLGSLRTHDPLQPPTPILCWEYRAKFKNSNKIFSLHGDKTFPKTIKIPFNVDISSGIMMDEGKFVNSKEYSVIQ